MIIIEQEHQKNTQVEKIAGDDDNKQFLKILMKNISTKKMRINRRKN